MDLQQLFAVVALFYTAGCVRELQALFYCEKEVCRVYC